MVRAETIEYDGFVEDDEAIIVRVEAPSDYMLTGEEADQLFSEGLFVDEGQQIVDLLEVPSGDLSEVVAPNDTAQMATELAVARQNVAVAFVA